VICGPLTPIQRGIAEQTLRAHTLANDDEQHYQDAQHAQEQFDKQVQFDQFRQQQAQEYKRITGEDVPDDFWQSDSQGHQPGEMGWHWSAYDPKSPIPIDVQMGLKRSLSEAATLPPGATRAQKVAAAVRDAKTATRQQHLDAILADAQSHAIPDEQDAKGEPNPQAYIPKETIQTLQDMAKDPTTDPDQMQKRVDAVKKAHAQEVAGMEARTEALGRIDNFFGRMSEMDMAYGDTGATKKHDPMDWELARALRHEIESSKLSGKALQSAEERVYATLKGERPVKSDNDKTGLNAGKALELAMQEAADPTSALSKKIKAAPEDQREMILEARARGLLNSARNLAGQDTPSRGGPNPNGSYPNTPADQARAAKAVNGATEWTPQKAQAAGWTEDDWVKYRKTGVPPK